MKVKRNRLMIDEKKFIMETAVRIFQSSIDPILEYESRKNAKKTFSVSEEFDKLTKSIAETYQDL